MAAIDQVFANLNTQLRNFKREFGVEFTERVKNRTPVRSGRLSRGWGFEMKKTDIEIYNVVPYASFIEYGTPTISPRGMLRRTLLESQEIANIAAERAKK